jgi:hypothetical protein
MNFVEPIRDKKKIAQIKNLLRGQRRFRDLLLLVTGINTALRASDLLTLRIGQVVTLDGQLQSRFWIREEKRGQAWKLIAALCHDVGLNGNYGTHTLRKT